MSVTSKLKRGVDLPVWEWLRPLQVATGNTGPSTFATGGKPYGRYIYHFPHTTSIPYRYDTWTEGWTALTPPPQSQATVASSRYNDYHGYMGRAISAGSGSNTLQCAVPKGNKCVGKKIKIIYGTGAGQVRTITAVSDPTVHDTMVVNSGSTTQIVDSNKSYTNNQWRDYGIRIVGNLSTDFRKVLYNSNNTITFANNIFSTMGLPWAYSVLPITTSATAGSQTIVQIESYEITVDTNWDTAPDGTSVFVIQSGVVWNANVGINRFGLQFYDVLNDNWYQSTSVSFGLLDGNMATDVAIETLNESAVGVLRSGSVTSATSKTIDIDGGALISNQYRNYIVRITSGVGFGQDRLITACAGNTITVFRAWDTNPDSSSTFEIITDNDKMYMQGKGLAAMFEYDAVHDMWSDSRILEVGLASNLCAKWSGYKRPLGINTITRSGTTATATTTLANHGLKTGDLVSIHGATDPLYNVTNAVITVTGQQTFTYTMAGTPTANAVAAASQSVTTLVDPSKNWTTNELVGKVVTFITTAYTATATFQQTFYHRVITSNTAATITFDSGTAPTTGTSVYYITDLACHGSIFTAQCAAGSTTTNVVLATSSMTTNQYAGRRAIVKDGANWAEFSISSNTNNTLVASAALTFTPTSSAIVTILGAYPTGAGVSLEYLYNTSVKQKGRYIYAQRGGVTNYMYLYDITTNTWEVLNQMPNAETFTIGSMTAYDGDDRVYIQRDSMGRILYYDFTDNNLYAFSQVPLGMSTATLGNKMSIIKTEDGLKFLYLPRHSGSEFWRTLLWV